jgi:branched-chain amino acid transport system permease protein
MSPWYLFDVAGLPYPVAIWPAIAVAAGCGFAADQLLFRFTRNNLINGLLVSIGLISIIEAAALRFGPQRQRTWVTCFPVRLLWAA